MNHAVNYPYASGDLLEARNTYFYSAFHGSAFLDAWRRQRADAMRDMASANVAAAATDGNAGNAPVARPTDVLLASIHRRLCDTSDPPFDRQALDRLVQRFEVSKRLHGEYDANWRPVDPADYRSAERYVRFAEVLDIAYARTGALPYLNALLKIVDTLTALRDTLSTQQRTRLLHVIADERDHVEHLAARTRGPE